MMVSGEYSCTLDAKNRISFPAKFRDEIGTQFIIARWMDNCLMAVPPEDFKNMVNAVTRNQVVTTRDLNRFFYGGAATVEIDKQGRVVIPQKLRDYASLEKEIIVVGVGDHAEIWAADKWRKLEEGFDADKMAEIMEEMEKHAATL